VPPWSRFGFARTAGGEAAESVYFIEEKRRKCAARPRRQTTQKRRLESRLFRSLADLAGVGK
jgi:hypothetical protein